MWLCANDRYMRGVRNKMKRMGKRKILTIVFLSAFLLLVGKRQYVNAQEALQIGVDQYEVSEGKLLVYVNKNREEFIPSISSSSLLVGKQNLEIEGIQQFSELNEPVTYLCLVDVSGSMTKGGIEQTKEILKQFIENKGSQDNFCITTMGNNLISSGFLSDSAQLDEIINGIERTSEDTNLYYGIKEEINILNTDPNVHKKRCLLIFSDGADYQTVGITREEAETAVKDSHIPVFTIAMLKENPKDTDLESAKILGSFARYSAGGEHYAPQVDGYEYSEIITKVNTRIQASMVLAASLEGLIVGDETVYIEVELSDGTEKAKDGMTVPAGNIADAVKEIQREADVNITIIKEEQAAEEPVEEEVIEEEPILEEEPVVEESSNINKYIVIGALLAALVIIVALVLIVLRRKNSKKVLSGKGTSSDKDNQEHESDSKGSTGAIEKTIAFEDSMGEKLGKGIKKYKSSIEITLFKVGPGAEESYQLTVKGEASIGRNESCKLTLDNDNALSGRHCSFIYREGDVFVRDDESTNGTYVNGVPIVGEFKVEKDDVLMIGSSEYRIFWE